jgi:penicillin-binding protein 2
MTLIPRTPTYVRLAFALILFIALSFTTTVSAQRRRQAAAKSKPSAARNEKNARSSRGREKASVRDSRADRNRSKKASAREERARRDDDRRGARAGGARRERAAEARRRRQEALEAARRAEAARREAIARQRAADQALRDEAYANILKDDPTGEDLEVRRVAVAALGGHAGTVVVMNPKTGQIYSIVNQEWAVRRGFKPCSTIKLVTGLAGLTEKVIDPLQTVKVSDRNLSIDLTDSLAYSNNGYFQQVGGRVGFDRMISYARQMGLGERTGINHPLEYTGRVPAYKTGFAANRMCSHGDDFEVTPVQLANLVSAIANGGKLMVPHLPRTPQETVRFQAQVRRQLMIPQDALQRIIPGMIGAVNYGTGKGAYDPTQTVAGKTGTCIGQGSWLGLFASYAPVVDPNLAVVVVVRGSGERGRIAAGISGKIFRGLSGRFGKVNGQMAVAPATLQPRPKIDPRSAAAVSDEDAESAGGGVITDTLPNTGGSKTRSVIMTAPVRPTEVTTRPSVITTTAPKAGQQKKEEERPRRVLTNRP